MKIYDCIIVGGGPAGLNAAVVLGRCRRKVLVFDTGLQRNRHAHGMHNYLTRDGIPPARFLQLCMDDLKKYDIEFINRKVTKGIKLKEGVFEVVDEKNNKYRSRKLLVATGLIDTLPSINGIKEMYGKSVFHCPYCDGWEVKDKKLGVYAKKKNGAELAMILKGWSKRVVLYTDGGKKLTTGQRKMLQALGIPVFSEPWAGIEGIDGKMERIVFQNGSSQDCDALFFVNGYSQHCNLAESFGCEVDSKGVVITNRYQQTKIPGLYVAGDADKDMHFVVVAAAEGAKAGVIINKELQKESAAGLSKRKNPS